MISCYSSSELFAQSEFGKGRIEFVLAVDLMHWRFEDRPMGWSGDLYRFVE